MGNRIEAVRNYLGSVANRTIGRQAWREAIQNSTTLSAPSDWFAEFVTPATWRCWTSALADALADIENSKPFYIEGGKFLGALATDIAVWAIAFKLSHNPLEFACLKLVGNAATHVGLDIVGAAAKRVRNFRPSGTTLAI